MEDQHSQQAAIDKSDMSSIKDWAVDDRPREKLLAKGKGALTNPELLAIIIGSGNRNETAVALMQRILRDCEDDLNVLGTQSVEELMRYKGIGEAKAISIVAMLELGRRRKAMSPIERPQLTSSQDAYDIIAGDLMDLPYEEFWILLINTANRLIKKVQVSNGGMRSVLVDPKIVFKIAIDHRANGIILAHNHPSGQLIPSDADIELTKKLVDGGKLLEIAVFDHIIIGGNGYYSFADEEEI